MFLRGLGLSGPFWRPATATKTPKNPLFDVKTRVFTRSRPFWALLGAGGGREGAVELAKTLKNACFSVFQASPGRFWGPAAAAKAPWSLKTLKNECFYMLRALPRSFLGAGGQAPEASSVRPEAYSVRSAPCQSPILWTQACLRGQVTETF